MLFYSYIIKCQLQFSHSDTVLSLIILDDITVISYFIPRHQMLKFSYSFKAKRYNVNLVKKN